MTTDYIGSSGSVTKVPYISIYATIVCVGPYLVVPLIVIVKHYHLYFKSLCCVLFPHDHTSCIVLSDCG